MDDSAGTSGTPEQPRKRQRCDSDTDYMQLMQQHVQLQQQQRQQQQQQQQQPNAFCSPGPANNFGPGPANNFGPVPANNFGPGPANNFGPGLANNFQAFMNQALQAQQAQFNAFCQQMSLTGPVATMMQHMQQLARFPMPGPPPMPPPPPGAPQWPQQQQQQQHVNGMSQQPRQQLKRGRRPKKGQAMVQKPGALQGQKPGTPQGQKPGIPQGQMPMQPKLVQGQPQAQTSFGRKRCVSTWTCYEPDGPPRSYVSDKKWSSQRKVRVTDAEGQCPYPFIGRTVSDFVLLGPQTVMPPEPQSRYCDVCGGLVLNELRHKESRKHREAVELDVALICARIRRDPAFAAAVISAARECIDTTGVAEADSDNSDMSLVDEEDDDDYDDVDDDGGDKYKDDDEPPPGKKGSEKPSNQQPSGAVASSSTDDFGFLENEVFRRAPDGNKPKGGLGK